MTLIICATLRPTLSSDLSNLYHFNFCDRMQMFGGSKTRSILIKGGNFTSVQSNTVKGIDRLYDKVARGAFHDSSERYDPPKCHPGTREVIIKEIMDWIKLVNKDKLFLWLYGPAGAGKSAIAQTIAELCRKAGLLAASFFFSRTASGRDNATLLIPTIAYQLTTSIPEIVDHISMAIERDPLIFDRSLEAQYEVLILKPLSTLLSQHNHPGKKSRYYPRLIIIDGLDECDNTQSSHRYILSALSSCLQHSSVPFIFLVASRPEQDIRSIFNQDRIDSMTFRLVLDDHYQPDSDIRRFLISKFNEIKAEHPLALHLPPSWPSPSEVETLVGKSSGQFIYASTVIRFVESPRHRPTDRLDVIFGQKIPGKQVPFAELDALYRLLFSRTQSLEAVLEVFAFLLLYNKVDDEIDIPYNVEKFLGYQSGDLQIILADFHSLIFVPSPSPYIEGDRLRIFHVSLGDFLLDRSRSGIFFIDAPKAHGRMAERCIHHMISILEMGDELYTAWETRYLVMACKNLMSECINAHPTKELLHQLSSFRFDQFLLLASEYTGFSNHPWDAIMGNLPDFFRWLEQQCPTSHTEGCLCRCYMTHFESFLFKKLSVLPPLDPYFQCMLAISTFDSYPKDPYWLAFVIWDRLDMPKGDITGDYSKERSRLSYLLGLKAHAFSGYRTMMVDFLTDHARSKSYYMNKSKYMDLAMILLQYLCNPKVPPESNPDSITDSDSLSISLEILSRFPREPQLVMFLRTNRVRDDLEQRQDLVLAIEAYIKEYDLSNAEAPPSGSESPGPSAASRTDLVPLPESVTRKGSIKNWMRKWLKKDVKN